MKGKSEEGDVNKSLLDKDWGAKIPDYITKGTFSLAVFLMSLTLRGVWLCSFCSVGVGGECC